VRLNPDKMQEQKEREIVKCINSVVNSLHKSFFVEIMGATLLQQRFILFTISTVCSGLFYGCKA
jgi:hypothetical protein